MSNSSKPKSRNLTLMTAPGELSSLLAGCHLPEYEGNSILNLLASIVTGCGGHSPHAVLSGMSTDAFRRKHVLLVILDGLGVAQLEEHLSGGGGKGFLGVHAYRAISTVFPATSATALTTLSTGVAPVEHAVLGWHVNLSDLGAVSTIFFAQTRTGMPVLDRDIDFAKYLNIPSYLNTIRRKRHLLSLARIIRSRYSQAATTWHSRRGYTTLTGMRRQLLAVAAEVAPAFTYAYWPDYDGFCHEYGTRHAKTRGHIEAMDAMLAGLVDALSGRDVCVVVTADHGLVDARPAHCIDLSKVAGFYECLATLPAGDKRSVFCFVRPAAVKRFRAIVARELGDACVLLDSEDLVKAGIFGPGRFHAAFKQRVGDFVLLAKGDYGFDSPVYGSELHPHVGKHGGMSPREMRVPLYVLDMERS